MQQTPAHDVPNPELLALLPPASRVVEVGCSSGALARAFKARHPDCHYLGIEVEASFAAMAEQHCDIVLVGDIEDLLTQGTLAPFPAAQCWVFGDTLEHLRDPWQVLRSLKSWLTEDGHVCACIPNMQHWSIQLRLNSGQLEYSESGLLDRTHLRWFTRRTMIQLFESCGFVIESMIPRIFRNPQNESACQLLGELARKIGHDAQTAMNDALPLQYVIRARRATILT